MTSENEKAYCETSKPKRDGDFVIFGRYEQNRKVEPIVWQILEEKDGELLLLSKDILDSKRFDGNSNNYKNSEIRNWLNTAFLNTAFSKEEQEYILTSNIVTDIFGGSTEITNDKIFLLSKSEIEKHFNSIERQKKGTDYAETYGLWIDEYDDICKGYSYWWLRSPSLTCDFNVNFVFSDGDFFDEIIYNTSIGVVPALRIKASDLIQ